MTIDGNCPVGGTYYSLLYASNTNYCSDKNAELMAPPSFQYIVCPNEEACGNFGYKYMTPSADGSVLTREIEKYSDEHMFVQNDICSWIITNPADMGSKDWMWLEIKNVDKAEVYVSYGNDYVFESRSASRATYGKKFAILKGKDYYVSSYALAMRRGYFKLKTWIEIWEDDEE